MDILKTLEHGNQDWFSMSDLVKATDGNANEIRPILKDLISEGMVIKIGEKRSTRYAIFGTEEPEDKIEDFTQAIRNIMLEHKGKIDRQTLCKKLDTYDLKMKPSLMEMVESGEVRDNGKKRGQLFWLAQHEDAGLIENDPEPEPKEVSRKFKLPNDSDGEASLMEELNDPIELVKHGLSLIPDGEEFLVMELCQLIHKSHNNHCINQFQVIEALRRIYRKKLIPRLHVVRRYGDLDGWRYYYCIGGIPEQFSGELMGRPKPKAIIGNKK
jgi:predicted transcriptional regulator